MFAQEIVMEIQKEREAFDAYFKEKYPELYKDVFDEDGDDRAIIGYSFAWSAWQTAKAQAVPEWISVEDELPTPNKTLSDAVIAWDGLCIRRIPLCLFKSASEVTHWMPIPQPPKAQEPAND